MESASSGKNNKMSGKKRPCVDYLQTVNLLNQLDVYPLPRTEILSISCPHTEFFQRLILICSQLQAKHLMIPIEKNEGVKMVQCNRLQ